MNIFEWQAIVFELPDHHPAEKLVLLRLGNHASADNEWRAWPGVATLAEETGTNRETVVRALKKGQGAGVIALVKRGNRAAGMADMYMVQMPKDGSAERRMSRKTDEPKDGSAAPHNSDEPAHIIRMSRNQLSRESSKESSTHRATDGFADFWEAYPRKVGKIAAQKAYSRAVKLATHEEIMRGVAAYGGTVRGRDPQYTAHPATWLNAGRWADEKPQQPNPWQYGGLPERDADGVPILVPDGWGTSRPQPAVDADGNPLPDDEGTQEWRR